MAARQAVVRDLDIGDWMDQRRRELALLGHNAEAAAHQAWDEATRVGQELVARTPADVRALGARLMAERDASH